MELISEDIQRFVRGPLCKFIADSSHVWMSAGSRAKSWNQRELLVGSESFLIQDYSPSPDLSVVEFVSEVIFPYHWDRVYQQVPTQVVAEAGLTIDPEGRPEAVIDLRHGTAEEHFRNLSSIKPLVKLLPRLQVTDTWQYDETMERDNLRYHLLKENLRVPEDLTNFHDVSWYQSLSKVCDSDRHLFRWDYTLDGVFLGHSLWALSFDGTEIYWIAPVQSRTEHARKLRVGNLMMLHAIKWGYSKGLSTINLGVDEFDYKTAFWKTRRIYKPGFRNIK